MQLRGIDDVRAGRITAFPWWADAFWACTGGVLALRSVRRIVDGASWAGVVAHVLLALVGVAVLLALGWAAFVKLRVGRAVP